MQNPNSLPTPGMASAVYRNGLEGMQAMMTDNPDRELPDQIIAMLQDMIEMPPKEVKGVSDDFLAGKCWLSRHSFLTGSALSSYSTSSRQHLGSRECSPRLHRILVV